MTVPEALYAPPRHLDIGRGAVRLHLHAHEQERGNELCGLRAVYLYAGCLRQRSAQRMYPQGRKTLFARVFDSRAECAKGFHQLPDRSFLHTRTAGE